MNEYARNVLNGMFAVIGNTNKLAAMIGAKQFAYEELENGDVSLRFKHMKGANKSNFFKLTYSAASDLYNMEFGRIHGLNYKVLKEYNSVFFDQLRELFEDETGLYLSL